MYKCIFYRDMIYLLHKVLQCKYLHIILYMLQFYKFKENYLVVNFTLVQIQVFCIGTSRTYWLEVTSEFDSLNGHNY